MDFKPLDAYWDLIEPLKKGDSLSHETWKAFLDIEANHIYVENQGFNADYLERLRKTMEYVYMPKNDSLLKVRIAAIEKDPASYWLTYKVYVYKKYEQELKAYEKKLQDPSYLDAMYDQTFGWLPKNLQKKDANTQFYLLGFENDAIAGGGVIIATLWDLYNQDRINFGSTAGHEMHHNLRKPIDFKNVAETDLGVLYFLNSVLNEGTADMIDKPANIALEAQLPNELRLKDFLLFQADSIVSVVDADITQMAASHGTVYQSEKDYRNLLRWTSGHCPGFYMADIIVRNGFKKKLIQNIRNPFAFIYLYNKAAKKDAEKPTLFSDTSIAYIKELETKYWVPLKLK
ncbi:MAG: DUF5700 domain-containing putative Zn-dependent protease [Aquaticitalea sp.]